MDSKTKFCIVVKAFLEHPTYTMEELAELPEIKAIEVSAKNIIKYLKDPSIIHFFDIWTYNAIQNKLNENIQSEKNVQAEHLEKPNSRLDGNLKVVPTESLAPIEKRKMNRIYTFTKIHLKYPEISFQGIAEVYNQNNTLGEVITADYVEECLTSKACCNFFADNIWVYKPVNLLEKQQENNDKRIK